MEKKKIVVLGAGLVGNAIAIDLSKKFDVTAVDVTTVYICCCVINQSKTTNTQTIQQPKSNKLRAFQIRLLAESVVTKRKLS